MKKRFVIIDGNAILHRAWHAMPPLSTKDGRLVSAAYGFTSMLLKVMKELAPTHLAVTFDLPGGTFRHEAFAAYKAQRVKQPPELYEQIPMVKRVLRGFKIPVYEKEGFEADDVIGTLSKEAPKDAETIIVTGDMDTLQLVDKRTKVFTMRKGFSDTVTYDEAAVKERFGLEPRQMIDYKAMRGDPSDNLPGLHGIGEKGAAELLQKFGDIENIYREVRKHPEDFKPRVLTALKEGEKDVPLSKQMVTIVRDVPLDFDFEAAKRRTPDMDELNETFRDLEFKSLLPRVESGSLKNEPAKIAARPKAEKAKKAAAKNPGPAGSAPTVFRAEDAGALPGMFKGAERLAWRFGYAGDDRIDPKFEQLALDDGKKCGACLFEDGRIPSLVKKFLEGPSVAKVGHDLKSDLVALSSDGIRPDGTLDDCMIMSYLLNPGSRAHSLSDLAFEITGRQASSQPGLFAEDRSVSACADARNILEISTALETKLKAENLYGLYQDIERPLIPVLAAMERHGVKVDSAFLDEMAGRMSARLEDLSAAIIKIAGEPFNINSPAQLQHVLFEVLKLPTKGIRRTGTGQFSTGADELEKLRSQHEIVGLLFEHREHSKLLSTYVSAIPRLVHPKTGRLHTHFNQAVTATGRLSSSDPNLQNIPIRTDLGREIRKAFIADAGKVLIAADYSQIELRIAASIADDAKMLEAFREKRDIHTATAAEIWEVAPEKVTFEQRRAAKAINFGILYGMGSASLAESAGVSRDDARKFIERYLSVYKGLKDYMDRSKEQARSAGYVETLFGRRRYLPEINSGVPFVRAEAERMAINMPVQGTSADIIKKAMIRLNERIGREFGFEPGAKLKMILQVHDELVFEADEKLASEVSPWIRETMENVVSLKAPIMVDVETGKNWGEMDKAT